MIIYDNKALRWSFMKCCRTVKLPEGKGIVSHMLPIIDASGEGVLSYLTIRKYQKVIETRKG